MSRRRHNEEEPVLERDDSDDAGTASEAATSSDARVAELESECAILREKWMRAQADYQNQRRRASAEHELAVRRALQPLLEELLHVLDFLDMALATPAESEEARNLAVGVDMTRQRFLQALESAGVVPILTGEGFDPALQEATATEVTDAVPPGTVLRVVRRGYTWNEVVLRHAHVVVAVAPGGSAAEEAPSDTAS